MVEKKTSFSPHEVLGAITVGLVSVSMGLVSGFGTISLADLPLDPNQGSWFVSVDLMIAIPFAPLGGKITQHFGIKKTFLLCAPLVYKRPAARKDACFFQNSNSSTTLGTNSSHRSVVATQYSSARLE